MKSSEYAEYLYEVGTPVRNKARDIQHDRRQAFQQFEAAKRAYDLRCADIEASEQRLAKCIKSLWNNDEIRQAQLAAQREQSKFNTYHG